MKSVKRAVFLLLTGFVFVGVMFSAGGRDAGGGVQAPLRGWGAFTFDDTTGQRSYNDKIGWQEAAKKLGIEFEWTVVTTAANNPQIQFGLLMASGDLPDFFLDLPAMLLEEYGRRGALAPLENLIRSNITSL